MFVLLVNAGAASADEGSAGVNTVDPVNQPENYSAVL